MPFKSKAQSRAAFAGALGPSMKQKAKQWADETPGGISALPDKASPSPSSPSPSSPLRAPRFSRTSAIKLPKLK